MFPADDDTRIERPYQPIELDDGAPPLLPLSPECERRGGDIYKRGMVIA